MVSRLSNPQLTEAKFIFSEGRRSTLQNFEQKLEKIIAIQHKNQQNTNSMRPPK